MTTHEVPDELGGRRLVLVPGQGEHGAALMDLGGDPLCRLLGRMRAHVLRTADGPVSMRQLAAAVGRSPQATSYHCDQPETTGLILRDRHGKSIWVRRTARGHEPVDLLSA